MELEQRRLLLPLCSGNRKWNWGWLQTPLERKPPDSKTNPRGVETEILLPTSSRIPALPGSVRILGQLGVG
ncbi:hypothetical protein SLA2020_340020 [Shorea laevis]